MHDIVFSDAQTLGALDSTGEVSDNVFNMEEESDGGAVIIEDDQLVGVLNITIPPLAGQVAGDEGMDIGILSNDNADMATGVELSLGSAHATQAELVAGCVKNIEVIIPLTQRFVGVWYKATSTTLTTGQLVDAHFSIAPLTENDKLQKVPSR